MSFRSYLHKRRANEDVGQTTDAFGEATIARQFTGAKGGSTSGEPWATKSMPSPF